MKKATTLIITLILCVQVLWAQKIQGIVFDQETKAPLWGASVSVKGSQKGNVTDAKGHFNLIVSSEAVLVVRFVGYEPVEIVAAQANQIALKKSNFLQDEVVVRATRADENSAMAYSNVSAAELGKSNLGQDMPQLLNFTPSVVTTSDAGASVGYTGIRIRGSDATRVNVTVNGIPINDSESQGTFLGEYARLCEFGEFSPNPTRSGNLDERSGCFWGSVNMQTNSYEPKAYGEVNASSGSFGTLKTTIKAGSGLLGGKFTIDGRLSRIVSDGYIDRASSNLQSAYVSAGYFGTKSFIRLNYFTGKEKTYQSWYGTPESRINGSVSGMQEYIDRNYLTAAEADNLLKSGRTYNYYTFDNQTDNYAQDHVQFITNHRLSEVWNLDLNAHYTYGRGYYEEYKPDADMLNYGVTSIVTANVIRRKWLDNDFYGSTFALHYTGSQKFKFTFGGAWNRYIGRHYGVLVDPLPGVEWYRSRSQKTDMTLYAKTNVVLSDRWNAYLDLQYRTVGHVMQGTADKFLVLANDKSYSFFNPKFGLTHQISDQSKIYASVSAGAKEPSRQDFVDNPLTAPRPEYVQDYELGYQRSGAKYGFQLNGYFMDYQDQLVLTGAVNAVGEAIRTNAASSYRLGVEAVLNYQLSKRLFWNGNLTLSQNRIRNFQEKMTDYDTYDQVVINHGNTDIAYSPSVIAGNTLTYSVGAFETSLLSKYVGKQYLDNTSDEARSIKAYATQDIRLKYTMKKGPAFTLLLNNVLNELYSSNGYTYSYRYGGATTTENFYYPQAGFNFLLGASIRF